MNANPVTDFYRHLKKRFGHRNWWPGDTPDEIIIGALLTQNTAWTNVEKAIANLSDKNLISLVKLSAMQPEDIAPLIRPSGYFNQKAKRLVILASYFVDRCNGDTTALAKIPLAKLREELLALNGVGEETADSILNYALNRRIFVVDAYTRRISSRFGWTPPDIAYSQLQHYFTQRLPKSLDIYQDCHAQIVYLGKDFCKPRPRCETCPVCSMCRKLIN